MIGLIGMLVVSAGWFAWDRLARTPSVRDNAPSWSPDSRRIVFASERPDGTHDIFAMNTDGSNPTPVVTNPADDDLPAVSPDGRQVAFDSNREGGDYEIFVMNLDRPQLRRLTKNPARDTSPVWSPDGRHLAFLSDRGGAKATDLFVMHADGSNVERLTTTGGVSSPQYSSDGTRIAFVVGGDIDVVDLSTRAVHQITQDPNHGTHPAWSPDSTQIAFMAWRHGRSQIFRMNADGSDQRAVVMLPSGSAVDPRWSPDGRSIAFVQTQEAAPDVLPDPKLSRAIYTVDIASGRVTRLSR